MKSIWEREKDLAGKIAPLWDQNLSTTQIAVALGHNITRNGVASKMSQMRRNGVVFTERNDNYGGRRHGAGFVLPATGSSVAKNKTKTAPVKIVADTTQEPKPIGLTGDFPDKRVSGGCRWIHGDPRTLDFTLCGHPGYPYCLHHAGRAHQPQTGKSAVDPAIVRKSGINRALG